MQIFGKVPVRPVVDMPRITPQGGEVAGGTLVKMTTSTKGAIIYYTVDHDDHNTGSRDLVTYDDKNPPKIPHHASGRKV